MGSDVEKTWMFHLGHILSITTDRLLSLEGISGVYKIVDFMTGETHMTHQLPRAANACKPYLHRQFPWLKSIAVPTDISESNLQDFLSALASDPDIGGEWHQVSPIPAGEYTPMDPMEELFGMLRPDQSVIVVVPPNEDPDFPDGADPCKMEVLDRTVPHQNS